MQFTNMEGPNGRHRHQPPLQFGEEEDDYNNGNEFGIPFAKQKAQ